MESVPPELDGEPPCRPDGTRNSLPRMAARVKRYLSSLPLRRFLAASLRRFRSLFRRPPPRTSRVQPRLGLPAVRYCPAFSRGAGLRLRAGTFLAQSWQVPALPLACRSVHAQNTSIVQDRPPPPPAPCSRAAPRAASPRSSQRAQSPDLGSQISDLESPSAPSASSAVPPPPGNTPPVEPQGDPPRSAPGGRLRFPAGPSRRFLPRRCVASSLRRFVSSSLRRILLR